MVTQISFTADKDLKNMALEKAKNEGITLKALLTYAMKGFIEGKIGFNIVAIDTDREVEELFFEDKGIQEKAAKIAKLLK